MWYIHSKLKGSDNLDSESFEDLSKAKAIYTKYKKSNSFSYLTLSELKYIENTLQS